MNALKNKYTTIVIICLVLITLFINLYRKNEVPACLNSDEAGHGYNVYSIITTFRDEHSRFLPLRVRSFDDNKLPLYTYLSIPSIALLGMSEFSIRLTNVFIAVALLISSFYLFKKLNQDKRVALLGSFFVSTSIWTLIVTRHVHEASLATLCINISLYFLVIYAENKKISNFALTLFFAVLSTFAYHFGRIYLVAIVLCLLVLLGRKIASKRGMLLGVTSLFTLTIPLIVDIQYGMTRLSNLAFFKNIGFSLKIVDHFNQHPIRLIHNKLTEGILFVTNNYAKLLSSDFLTVTGDLNQRFGYPEMGPITPILFICAIIGIFSIYRENNKYRHLMLFLLLVAPLGNALTWQPNSITRMFFFIVPLSYFGALGLVRLANDVSQFISARVSNVNHKMVFVVLFGTHLFFLALSYDIYFNHYFKQESVQRAWECGNKELASYIAKNYKRFDRFYISTQNGQPYIFHLFYNKVDPSSFQGHSQRTKQNEYGFTQVSRFDKFYYYLPRVKDRPRTVYIGTVGEMNDEAHTARIKYRDRDIFLVREND